MKLSDTRMEALEMHFQERLDALNELADAVRKCRDTYWTFDHAWILERIKMMRLQAERERDKALEEARKP